MNNTELAWAAGFFDGEGSVSLIWTTHTTNTNPWWNLKVTVTNCDRPSLERFVAAVGVGRIYTKKPVEGRQVTHYVMAGSLVAERILRGLLPYLLTKKRVAELAIEARTCGQRRPYENIPEERWLRMIEIENAIKALNGRNYRKVTAEQRTRHNPLVVKSPHC